MLPVIVTIYIETAVFGKTKNKLKKNTKKITFWADFYRINSFTSQSVRNSIRF